MSPKTLVASFLIFLSSSSVFAALKISLVTVNPGPVIFESFGHTALIVENSDVPGGATVYEYGAVEPSRVLSSPNTLAAFTDLFESRVKTAAKKYYSPLIAIEDKGHIPLILKNRYLQPRPDLNREVIISELSLTDSQAQALVKKIEDDIASGEYNYDNYDNNCATRVRDVLFTDTNIGKAEREKLQTTEENISLQEIVLDSIDKAAAASPNKKVSLLPPALARSRQGRQAAMMLQMVGIPGQFSDSKEFLGAITNANSQLQSMGAEDPLAQGFHKYFFAERLTTKPIKMWQGLFMPERLRAALLAAKNPATGKPAIEKEFQRNTAEELEALRKASQLPAQP